jgi:TRAP-type C4-dicarboxylate transport system substrate-binding protein
MLAVRNAGRAVVALIVAAALATTGCQARDRAGGSAADVQELTFAINGEPAPQITAWVNEVDQLSKGTLKITYVGDARAGQPDAETGTIADVRAGTFDLGSVGVRAFDLAGVTSFQPLLAPLLVDSLELESKVFDAGIPLEMLSGVSKVDLTGIGVLPGPMRKVLGVNKPFSKTGDFIHVVVGIQDSGVARQTFHTLGATPKPVAGGASLDGLDAYDQQLSSIQGNHYTDQAKYVTGNLNLWPRPLVIIANHAAYDRLSQDQHDIMAAAAKDAVPVAMDAERADDANAVIRLCKAGLTFDQSSDADLAAFEKALAPVYATIRKDPANATRLDRITEIKQSLHRAPNGADCNSIPGDQQQKATRYDGTYEMSVVWPKVKTAAARCVGGPEAGPKGAIYDMVLEKGTLSLSVRVGSPNAKREFGFEGNYRFFKDQMQFGDLSAPYTVDFAYDGRKLTMSNLRGGECGDAAIWTTKPWIRQ